MSMLNKLCSDISYSINYSEKNDTFTFEYSIAGKRYTINIDNISEIETQAEAKELVHMIRENINYHLREQETNRR